LQDHGVPFEELVVAGNVNNLLQMYRLTKDRRVPVCARDDRVVVGFDPSALKKLLYGEEKLPE
jgi:hypothetical protein